MSLTLDRGRDILLLHMTALTELGSSDPEGDLFYNDVNELDGPAGSGIIPVHRTIKLQLWRISSRRARAHVS
jgi:hypothetical protein